MTTILETTKAFFAAEEWQVRQVGERPVLEMSARTEELRWGCFAEAREETHELLFYSVAPFFVPEQRRPDAAVLLTRINYGLSFGNFEMDWEDGEVRYKTGVDVEGDELTAALIQQVIYRNVRQAGRYLPTIQAMLDESLSPEEALARLLATST